MVVMVQVLLQVLNFVSVLASGLMIWKGLGLLTNTESPIVVVLRYVSPLPLPSPSPSLSLLLHDRTEGRTLTRAHMCTAARWSPRSTAGTCSS